MMAAPKRAPYHQLAWALHVAIVLALFALMSSTAKADHSVNLLPTACHFKTDSRDRFPSMLDASTAADCTTRPEQSSDVVWLSLDVTAAKPAADKDYVLAILRHWTERAIVQFHYADGTMVDYDVGPYEFDQYWSVGNFMAFPAPAREAPVTAVLVGLENASSITLFHQMSFVPTDQWEKKEINGRLLTMIITGILVAMLFYNIALAVVLRFTFHIHYCLVVFAALVYNLTAFGFVAHLTPGLISYGTQMNITILALGLTGLSGLLFLCSFLETGILSRAWIGAAKTIGYVFMGFSVVFVNMRGPYTETLELVLHLISFIGVLFVFAALMHAISRGSKAAIFYGAGWFLTVLGVLLRNLREFDLIPHSDAVAYSVSVGISLETIIFAIGIAYRIRRIMNERDNAKLESAKALAASQAKTDFLNHLSHEIRNPMSTIVGLSGLAAQTNLDDQQREYIRNIQVSGNVLMSLLNDTLDLSKIEAGKVSLETITFAPNDVFDTVLAVVGPKAQEKGLTLTFEGTKKLPSQLNGDPTRLSQILINLTNNAVKFTDNGSVTVVVKTAKPNETSVLLQCEVIDTGIGMSPNQLERVFHSFEQADASVNRKYGGSGLGLAICKQLVEVMGGTIRAESTLGAGSRFIFEMPFGVPAVQNSAAMGYQAATALSDKASDHGLVGVRVLVVEDNHINQLLISKLLEQADVEFEIASSGEEAVTMAARQTHDIILMDLNMPGIGGMESARIIRDNTPVKAQRPIIAITGHDDAETRDECLQVGINDLVVKPFTPNSLFDALRKWRNGL